VPWNKKGRKTRVTKNGDHLRINVIGMVCPHSGEFFAVCKNEKKLLERLDQTILDVIDNPQKTQQTTASGTLF
jgi:hypothetical protein